MKAMKVCARNAFLPEAHRNPEEAFMDSPIHLDGLHFNVSAPHMHATCLVRPPCDWLWCVLMCLSYLRALSGPVISIKEAREVRQTPCTMLCIVPSLLVLIHEPRFTLGICALCATWEPVQLIGCADHCVSHGIEALRSKTS